MRKNDDHTHQDDTMLQSTAINLRHACMSVVSAGVGGVRKAVKARKRRDRPDDEGIECSAQLSAGTSLYQIIHVKGFWRRFYDILRYWNVEVSLGDDCQ